MLVTPLGIIIVVKPVQPEKELEPINVTVEGITVFLHPTINEFVDFSTKA